MGCVVQGKVGIQRSGWSTHTRLDEKMVIVAAAGPKEELRLSAIGHGVSPREQEVVALAVRRASI